MNLTITITEQTAVTHTEKASNPEKLQQANVKKLTEHQMVAA